MPRRVVMKVPGGRAGLLAAGITAALALPGAGAALPSAQKTAKPSLDLMSRASVVAYLRDRGVRPDAIVFQRGLRNYAGASCPGKGWTCTRARVVVQIARAGGVNSFTCSPQSPGTAAPATCVVVQGARSGHTANEARCMERSTAPGIFESCDITQSNTGGDNRAFVDQSIEQGTGSTQGGSQYATVTQANSAGKNVVGATQRIVQSTHDLSAAGQQGQQGTQTIVVCQAGNVHDGCTAPSQGDNIAEVAQSLTQALKGNATGAIVQRQNSNAASSGAYDTVAQIAQHSTAGKNTVDLDQDRDQDGQATSQSGPVSQTQGNALSGIAGSVSQTSTGLSVASASQNESQNLQAFAPSSGVSQSQIGPLDCCSVQVSNPNDRFTIQQRSTQSAGVNGTPTFPNDAANATAFQSDRITTDCASSGVCDASNEIVQNRGHSTLTCTHSPTCNLENSCVNGLCNAASDAASGPRNGPARFRLRR